MDYEASIAAFDCERIDLATALYLLFMSLCHRALVLKPFDVLDSKMALGLVMSYLLRAGEGDFLRVRSTTWHLFFVFLSLWHGDCMHGVVVV